MSKLYKIAITNDTKLLRCRLIVKLIEICGAKAVLINPHLDIKKIKNNSINIDNEEIRQNVINDHLAQIKKVLDSCDAMVIPGNRCDVSPIAYGEKVIHSETARRLTKNKYIVRFETEKFMANYALHTRQIPLLGICGGMQVINVVLGGSLIQHIPDLNLTIQHQDSSLKRISKLRQVTWEKKFKNHILFNQPDAIFPETHPMQVIEGTNLATIYRATQPNIDLSNIYELSIHHQGCLKDNLASNLKVAAIAPDGIIEAAELQNHILCLLTQFHLECNVSGIAKSTISHLLEALRIN